MGLFIEKIIEKINLTHQVSHGKLNFSKNTKNKNQTYSSTYTSMKGLW